MYVAPHDNLCPLIVVVGLVGGVAHKTCLTFKLTSGSVVPWKIKILHGLLVSKPSSSFPPFAIRFGTDAYSPVLLRKKRRPVSYLMKILYCHVELSKFTAMCTPP